MHTKKDLGDLHDKATSFIQEAKTITMPVPWLYRNSTMKFRDPILIPSTKDNNGDPKSPINGKIKGIFFSASGNRWHPNDPPEKSPFGPYRICIPPKILLPECNLYFADFYCLTDICTPHYVTLVVTKPGSRTDTYCSTNLVKLDFKNNVFLKQKPQEPQEPQEPQKPQEPQEPQEPQGTYVTTIDDKLWVEVFYTEKIDTSTMKEKKLYDAVKPLGQGQDGKIKLKNQKCLKCNLIKSEKSYPEGFM